MRKLTAAFLMTTLLVACASNENNKQPEETSTLQSMNSPVDSVSAEPYLFTDRHGAIYLSWVTKESHRNTLYYSVLNREKWSTPAVIASGEDWFVNWADYPVIAANDPTSLIAHFLQKSETGKYTYDVKITASANQGKSWSTPVILHNDGKKAEHGFVSIVPYGDNYFISWLDGRNTGSEESNGHEGGHHGQMTLRGAIVDEAGKKISEWELDNRVCDCCQTSTAITSEGPVVVYRDRSENEIRDMSIVRLVNGKWTPPATIHTDNWNIAGCPVNGPRISAQGNSVAVAWFSSPDNNAQVNVAFSADAGATFAPPVRMDEGKAIGRVDIELIDPNTAMVSWMEGSVIKISQVHSDGKKDKPLTVASTSQSRSSGFPQMTKAKDGLVLAWTDDKEKTIKLARLYLKDTHQ